jgi:hypothetical protein
MVLPDVFPLDIFILAFTLAGFGHFIVRAFRRESIDSYYTGRSRLAWIGRLLGSRRPNRLAFILLEPLMAIGLVAWLSGWSMLLAVYGCYGIFVMLRYNWVTVTNEHWRITDLNDGVIQAAQVRKITAVDEERPERDPLTAARRHHKPRPEGKPRKRNRLTGWLNPKITQNEERANGPSAEEAIRKAQKIALKQRQNHS